jgi:hypothetical protein
MVTMTAATRDIKVSHWGTIDVHEHFEVQNIGTKIEGEFRHAVID